MVIPSARRLLRSDYDLVRYTLEVMITKLQRDMRKPMYRYLDLDAAMAGIYDFDDAYIVADSYLVIYVIIQPWWAEQGVHMLAEQLVLSLSVGRADFAVVPEFLEAQAREAGCMLAGVGTALARSDTALASLYLRHGFQPCATTLAKDTSGLPL